MAVKTTRSFNTPILLLLRLLVVILLSNCSSKKSEEFTEEESQKYNELKSQGLEEILGKPADVVGHAIIGFDIGGAVDMYYYPNALEGTGFATMELISPDGTGPIPNRNGTYELVAFTRHAYTNDSSSVHPFNLIERRMCGIFTDIGNYSFQAKLEPGETMEIPREGEPTKCIVFDEYKPEGKDFMIGESKHGLLLVIEVFRDEMEFAMENGSDKLFQQLKEAGHYPYSDLNRRSVLSE